MSDVWSATDDFSPILIENYIRTETAVKNIKNDETESQGKVVAAKFKIAEEYYKQLCDCEYPAPLIGLSLNYDAESGILTVEPDEKFLEIYENQIMRDVALQQSEKCKERYSKFISVVE